MVPWALRPVGDVFGGVDDRETICSVENRPTMAVELFHLGRGDNAAFPPWHRIGALRRCCVAGEHVTEEKREFRHGTSMKRTAIAVASIETTWSLRIAPASLRLFSTSI